MSLSRDQNSGQNHGMKIATRSFENVSQFKYLGMTATNQYLIQEEIKMRLNLGYAWYHSVQILLSTHLLPENIIVKYKTMIFLQVLYGYETWCLT
jgi:hypothetical protein